MRTELIKPPQGSEQSEQECVDCLLFNIPPEGGYVKRETIEKLIRSAFRGGWVNATHPEIRPESALRSIRQ